MWYWLAIIKIGKNVAILSTILGFAVPTIARFLYGKIANRRSRGDRMGRRRRTSGKPDIINVPKLPPKLQKALENALPEIMKELKKDPQKFPELANIVKEARELFPPQELEKIIPGVEDLPQMPPEADLKELDFDPIEARARKSFMEKTIPSLAERFTSLTGGGQRAGAFERQKAEAATDLESSLAALRAQMEPEYALKKAQYGLQRGKLGALYGQQALQRGQMLANLGLSQRQQDLAASGLGMQRAQAALQPEQFRRSLLAGVLGGGLGAAGYNQVIRPQQPSFWQGMAPGIGSGLGGLFSGLGQAAGNWLFS